MHHSLPITRSCRRPEPFRSSIRCDSGITLNDRQYYTKAVEWVEGLIEEREKHGSELFSLTHDQLAEARAAFERLAEYEVSLTAVVDHWIKFQAPLEVQRTFSQLEKEFITSRKGIDCKEKTLSQYRSLHERDLRGVRIDENGRDCAGRPRGLAKRIKLGSENTQKLFGNVDDVFRMGSRSGVHRDKPRGAYSETDPR
jgi:hypothetical protein